MHTHVAVIGGGAAGLMAAITAAKRGLSVTVIEKMHRPARKLMITGKGRCNVTNNTDLEGLLAATPKNPRFLYSAFSEFGPADTMSFFESEGVPLKTERGRRVFPVSDKASDIVDALVNCAKRLEVRFIFEAASKIITENGDLSAVELKNGETVECKAVIISTGGKSYPLTGSTGDGYEFARRLGHTVTPLKASIVPLVCFEGFCVALEGLSLKNVGVTVTRIGDKKPCFTDFGDLIFTSYGISGPVALSASAHMRDLPEKHYKFKIDLKPALDEAKLDARIQRDFSEFSGCDFVNSLGKLLPRKLIPIIVKLSKIPPHTRTAQVTRAQRLELVSLLKGLELEVVEHRPVAEAIVTSGGVKVSEIVPSSMESKLQKNVHFAGEVIDVDAYTGGFNLQIAFSTGAAAGAHVLRN